jgi:hypothetical protein
MSGTRHAGRGPEVRGGSKICSGASVRERRGRPAPWRYALACYPRATLPAPPRANLRAQPVGQPVRYAVRGRERSELRRVAKQRAHVERGQVCRGRVLERPRRRFQNLGLLSAHEDSLPLSL